jgi:hypothetical protein
MSPAQGLSSVQIGTNRAGAQPGLQGGRAASDERTISDNCSRISRTKRRTHVLTTGFVMMGNSHRRIWWWLSEQKLLLSRELRSNFSKIWLWLCQALPTTSVLAYLTVLAVIFYGKQVRGRLSTSISSFGVSYTSQLRLSHLRTRMVL